MRGLDDADRLFLWPQELNLSHNKIGVRGIKLICKTMAETQCPLKILDVTNCDITESGAAAIGEMLEYSSLKVCA